MTMPRGDIYPPGEFLDWLRQNYSQQEASFWTVRMLASPLDPTGWQQDPVYIYWQQYVLPSTPQGQMASASSPMELNNLLNDLVDTGQITENQAGDYFNRFYEQSVRNVQQSLPQETWAELNQFTSRSDLADRLNRFGLDQQAQSGIYDYLLQNETPTSLALRGAQGRSLTEQEKAQVAREERAQSLTGALSQTFNNPNVTRQDLVGIREALGKQSKDYLEGRVDSTAVSATLQNINARANQRSVNEGQTAGALLKTLNRPRERRLHEWQRTPMPTEESVISPFVEGLGSGEGTKLRSFIESEIPGIARDTREARLRWHKRMNPDEEQTFKSEQRRLNAEADLYRSASKSAPTSASAGGVFYGQGGLAGIAQRALDSTLANLANLNPADFPSGRSRPVKQKEDPLLTALRSRQETAIPRYYRGAGTGIVNRLSPSVRY